VLQLKNYFMKKLLLSLFLFTIGMTTNANAQATCASAITLTTNGTYTTGTINGTYKVACFATFPTPKGYWYKFTPTSNGEISISSNLETNNGTTKSDDTVLSIATGACAGALTCVAGNDDVDFNNGNYLAELLNVPVVAGTTYLIQWDNRYSSLPNDFTFTFTAIECARPTVFYLPEYSSTSSTDLYWDQTAPAPAEYEVDWSNDFVVPAGSGTSVTVPAGALAYSTANIADIPASSNFRFYTRANCGTSQSSWSGPFYGYLPVTLPYTNGFDDVSKNNTDGFINYALFNSTATSTPASYADGGDGFAIYTFNSTTAASDRRAYFRGVSLQAGEIATVTFKTRLYSIQPETPGAPAVIPSPMSFNLTVGDSQSALGQATVVQGFTSSTDASYTTHTASYTAATAGIYYFGLHNNTPAGATETFLFIDSIGITSNLSVGDNLVNSLTVYPNPSKDVINISNDLNAVVNSIEMSDLNGRVVKTQMINAAEGQVSISDLSAGVYMMKVITDQGTATKKVIKE
jgi:hypothetical protein